MHRLIVIHYSELALKRGNRAYFEKRLLQNIESALKGCGLVKAQRISGRFLLEFRGTIDISEINHRLTKVFGIAHFAEAWSVDYNPDSLPRSVWQLLDGRSFSSFRIDTRRADKSFPMNSMEINCAVGAYVQKQSKARVDLEGAELNCRIELVEGRALVSIDTVRGPGGLPVHTGGKIAVLLSGGIDSPVAAWRMIRRGCSASLIHFHSFPYTNKESQDKARQLATLLSQHQQRAKIFLVPFAEIQRQIMVQTPLETRVILYRRYMLRLAERIAIREGARILVTGDSLGQVASQTLENIDVITRAVRMPVLRPLVGSDKEEIIETARRIGSYEISILPDQDCCSLFVPKHPETRAKLEIIERMEEKLELTEEFQGALAKTEVLVQYPAYETGALHQF